MSVQGFDNHIQRDIFLKMRQHDVARYADIQIKTIESSQFMYHLKELMRMGLIEKVDKGRYRLTRKGIAVSQNFSTEKKNISMAPLTYSLIFARSTSGKYLVLKRNKQPYINLYACISGKVHMNETMTQAAIREWQEDTDLPAPQFSYKGHVSVMMRESDNVLHTLPEQYGLPTGKKNFQTNCKPELVRLVGKIGNRCPTTDLSLVGKKSLRQ